MIVHIKVTHNYFINAPGAFILTSVVYYTHLD